MMILAYTAVAIWAMHRAIRRSDVLKQDALFSQAATARRHIEGLTTPRFANGKPLVEISADSTLNSPKKSVNRPSVPSSVFSSARTLGDVEDESEVEISPLRRGDTAVYCSRTNSDYHGSSALPRSQTCANTQLVVASNTAQDAELLSNKSFSSACNWVDYESMPPGWYRDGVLQFYTLIITICQTTSVILGQAALFETQDIFIRHKVRDRNFNTVMETPLAGLIYITAACLLLTLVSISDVAHHHSPRYLFYRKVAFMLPTVSVVATFTVLVYTGDKQQRLLSYYIDVAFAMVLVLAFGLAGVKITRDLGAVTKGSLVLKKVWAVCACNVLAFLARSVYDFPNIGDGEQTTKAALWWQCLINFIPVFGSMVALTLQLPGAANGPTSIRSGYGSMPADE